MLCLYKKANDVCFAGYWLATLNTLYMAEIRHPPAYGVFV